MSDVIKFALLGLGASAVYALLATGVVVIYRGSGVVNFAQGSFAMVGAYTYYEMSDQPAWLAVAVAVGAAALCGLIVELAIMWPMRRSSPLARIVATLGVVAVISQAAEIRYGDVLRLVNGFLPSGSVQISGSIVLPQDRIWLIAIATVIITVLWLGYRYTRFGLVTSAVAENQDAAAGLGWSPRSIAAVNWTIGGALAGVAGVLFAPIGGINQSSLSLAIIPALSAAIVGGFISFPLTLLGALIIGVLESETTRWISTPGWNVAVPFLVIVVILVTQGKALPVRSFLSDRLPRVGTGRIRPVWVLAVLGLAIASTFAFSSAWAEAMTVSAIAAIICLSIVIVTGYAGQISLAQYALAGMGAFFSSRLAGAAGVPFPWSWVLGVAFTMLLGVIVALPALRARGVNLAVITLGFSVVIDSVILSNPGWTGGLLGTTVPAPVIFGINFSSVAYPQRYAALCLVLLGFCCLMVANLRRGRAGRRLLAVRDNERAAASVGVSVVGAKIYAFAIGAGFAALGGILGAFQFTNVQFSQYSPLQDVNFVMFTVIGGIGYVFGAVIGGIIVIGGVVQSVLGHWFTLTNDWLLILGLFLLVQVVLAPDGVAFAGTEAVQNLKKRLADDRRLSGVRRVSGVLRLSRVRRDGSAGAGGGGRPPTLLPSASIQTGVDATIEPKALELRDITVIFGSTRALDGISLTVRPGEVVGLIGPNGAGKTTLIDVATGFVRPSQGHILLGGTRIDGKNPRQRVQLGVTRSWQSLELFDVMTVEENLRTAGEHGGLGAYLADLFWTRSRVLPDATRSVVMEFGLADVLHQTPDSLPYAIRRLVGIGRAVATTPSILLLDEPAAGLDESSTAELTRLIRRLAREWGMGILLVEHDVAMVMATCDRIMAIQFGREMLTGSPDEVRSDPRVIESYLGSEDVEPEDDGSLVTRSFGRHAPLDADGSSFA